MKKKPVDVERKKEVEEEEDDGEEEEKSKSGKKGIEKSKGRAEGA